jgi:hypothetical protein
MVTMGCKRASRPAACTTAVEKGACPKGGAAAAAAAALQAAGGEGGLLTLRGGRGDRPMTKSTFAAPSQPPSPPEESGSRALGRHGAQVRLPRCLLRPACNVVPLVPLQLELWQRPMASKMHAGRAQQQRSICRLLCKTRPTERWASLVGAMRFEMASTQQPKQLGLRVAAVAAALG